MSPALPGAPAAMDSSQGRETAAPAPRSRVRREILRGICRSAFTSSACGKALTDYFSPRRRRVLRLGSGRWARRVPRRPGYCGTGRSVRSRESAYARGSRLSRACPPGAERCTGRHPAARGRAQSRGLGGKVPNEIVLALEQNARNSTGPLNFSPEGSDPAASIDWPLVSLSRQRPIQSKFSRPKPIGSMRLWQVAQDGSARWRMSIWRIVSRVRACAFSSGGTSGGGGGTGVPSSVSSTQAPRRTGLVWR